MAQSFTSLPRIRLALLPSSLKIKAALIARQWLLAVVAIAIALPATWVLLTRGLPGVGHDTPVHLMRLYLLDMYVHQGKFFPRWFPELYLGYGYPLFNFYTPFMYYLSELLHISGLGEATAYIASYVLAILTGAIGAALLVGAIYANDDGEVAFWPGLLGATAFTYSPYLFTNVYIRGAFAEVGAMALLPWIFWSFRRIAFAQRKVGAIGLAGVLLALLAIMHTITLSLTVPFLVAYALFFVLRAGSNHQPFAPTLFGFGAAFVLAALLSAGVWAPLFLERHYVSESAYMLERLLKNLWSWTNFIGPTLRTNVINSGKPPYKLGLIQVVLVLLGVVCTRRRSGEWWFWLGAFVVGILAMSPAAAGFYSLSKEIAVIQFPWRMLTLVAVTGAVLSGGVATVKLPLIIKGLLATALIIVVLFITTPRPVDVPNLFAADDVQLSLSSLARFEAYGNAYGAGWNREFLPRWARHEALFEAAPPESAIPVQLAATATSDESWEVHYKSNGAFPLSLSQFYFPGWRATLDSTVPLNPAPSPRSGEVVVNAPAGEHTVAIWRAPTTIETFASIISLLTLTLLASSLFFVSRTSFVAIGVVILLVAGGWIAGTRAAGDLSQQKLVQVPWEVTAGLRMVDIKMSKLPSGQLWITPTWFVQAQQPDLHMHWRLLDVQDQVISELKSTPHFGILSSIAWDAGTLVSDGYELALPADLRPGSYHLEMRLLDKDGEAKGDFVTVLSMQLSANAAGAPAIATNATYSLPDGTVIAKLTGVSTGVNGKAMQAGRIVIKPGDNMRVDAYWQVLTADIYRFQSSVEVRDWLDRKIAAPDLNATAFSDVIALWQPYLRPHENSTVHIPEGAPSGLYSLHVGIRDRTVDKLINVVNDNGEKLDDTFAPQAIKIVAQPSISPAKRIKARFGDTISLQGYTLEEGEVDSGDVVTLTLFYKANEEKETEYTRFVHLYSPALGMAAQYDSLPAQGSNPTSTWVKGEEVVDPVTLPLAADSTAGCYDLLIGFYDPQAGAVRLPAFNAENKEYADDSVKLEAICLPNK